MSEMPAPRINPRRTHSSFGEKGSAWTTISMSIFFAITTLIGLTALGLSIASISIVKGGGSTNTSDFIVGPASATNNAVVRFDSTTGKLAQNSVVTIDDNGTLHTDTINEMTPAFGVTVDGVLCKDGGVTLATEGGIAASLDYYEEDTSFDAELIGPWNSNQNITFKITRIGSIVTLAFDDVIAATGLMSDIVLAGAIPSKFIPQFSIYFVIRVVDEGIPSFGILRLVNTGQMIFTKGADNSQFSGLGGLAGVSASSITYPT